MSRLSEQTALEGITVLQAGFCRKEGITQGICQTDYPQGVFDRYKERKSSFIFFTHIDRQTVDKHKGKIRYSLPGVVPFKDACCAGITDILLSKQEDSHDIYHLVFSSPLLRDRQEKNWDGVAL